MTKKEFEMVLQKLPDANTHPYPWCDVGYSVVSSVTGVYTTKTAHFVKVKHRHNATTGACEYGWMLDFEMT